MNVELVTRADLDNLKAELLAEIRGLLRTGQEPKQWLKSRDVCKLLGCSMGTLQTLRINGSLPFRKVGGTLYYQLSDVEKLLGGC
jgi:hypothetical protein